MSVPFNTKQFAGPDSPLPLKRIPLANIHDTQVYFDGAKIDRMAKTWSKDMAPPVVAQRNGEYFVLDGHHRKKAAEQRGHTYLQARVSSQDSFTDA